MIRSEETGIIDTNQRTILLYANQFEGLERYLTDFLQIFSKLTDC